MSMIEIDADIEKFLNTRLWVSLPKIKKKINQFNEISQSENFWDKPSTASELLSEKSRLENILNSFVSLENELSELKELHLNFKNDADVKIQNEILEIVKSVKQKSKEVRLKTLLSEEADNNDCYLEIHAGAGGTESQDWAEMLSRMYSRLIEKISLKKRIIHISEGEQPGISQI